MILITKLIRYVTHRLLRKLIRIPTDTQPPWQQAYITVTSLANSKSKNDRLSGTIELQAQQIALLKKQINLLKRRDPLKMPVRFWIACFNVPLCR